MDYIIRFATDSDIENIMQFINEYWKKGHILSRNRELFEWQYGGKSGRINIVIGLDQNHTIQDMLGFIPYADSDEKNISLVLWKANPSAAFLGIRLIKFLMEHESHREIVCPGINLQTTAKIYRHINMKVGTMSQWYRLSPQKNYLIAKIANHTIPVYNNSDSNAKLIKINTPSELNKIFNSTSPSYTSGIPFKSIPYIIKRYFKNPIYEYLI